MRFGPVEESAASHPSRSFEAEWPDLARRLHSMLAGKRIPATKREDIVQETGLRLFRMWEAVDPDRPVWALAVTIALNLVRDEARRGIGREILGVVPDMAAPHEDVERSGLARIELGRVERAMAAMTPDHRSILLAEVGDAAPTSDRGPNAVKMLRMRARRRLTTLLDAASAGSAIFVGRIRKALGLDQHLYTLQSAAGANQAQMPAVAGVLAVISILAAVPGTMGLFGEGLEDATTPEHRKGASLAAGAAGDHAVVDDLSASGVIAHRDTPRDLGRGRTSDQHRPYRVPVPVEGAGFLEGEGEVGVMGMGVKLGEREGNAACFFGLPVRGAMEPRQLACTSPARGSRSGEPVYVRGRVRGRFGPVRWQVEV